MPEGVIRDKVAWFVVIYQFPHEQVLIAKPTPPAGGTSCSTVMQRRGAQLAAPTFEELVVNTDNDAIVALLSRLLGTLCTSSNITLFGNSATNPVGSA